MNKLRPIYSWVFIFLFLLWPSISHAQQDTDFAKQMHDEIVNEQLNSLESDDTSTPPKPEPLFKDTTSPIKNSYYQDKPQTFRNKRHFDLAFQTDSMHYQTGDKWPYYYSQLYTTSDKIKKNDTLNGVFASVFWNGPVHSWKAIHSGDALPNFGKIEIEYLKGSSDYSSNVAGKRSLGKAWKLDIRFLFGYDYALTQRTDLTTYLGIGYIRYSDRDGDWVDFALNAYEPYTAITDYFYVPIGFETHTDLNDLWAVNFKFEGDIVAAGQISYHLNELPSFYGQDLSTGQDMFFNFRPTRADLRGGLGFRTSLKIIRKFRYCDFYAQPYVNLMYLAQSKHVVINATGTTAGGSYVSAYPNGQPYLAMWDAKSITVDVGARFGVDF